MQIYGERIAKEFVMDYIFIIGPSAVGKTTLAKELYQHYEGVYLLSLIHI